MAKPKKCITPQDAEKLFTHWSKTRGETLRESLGEHDTCEFSLSISEIREYLDYVEDQSTKQGIANPGVRLYFGAYDASKSDKTTFFLAPTKGKSTNRSGDDDDDNNYDIDAWNFHEGGWPPTQYNP
ncbi:hypothetical protein [uncultured Dokdonia sp.]|uniref:hypothetical protein n=1 Tax=uncultured Dokdonia sp. TaxID=575653 RepID=UPI00263694C1|nr:hypothetical protein [uncultured Dokdonia sp.]